MILSEGKHSEGCALKVVRWRRCVKGTARSSEAELTLPLPSGAAEVSWSEGGFPSIKQLWAASRTWIHRSRQTGVVHTPVLPIRCLNKHSSTPLAEMSLKVWVRHFNSCPANTGRVPHSSHPKPHPQKVYYVVTSFQMLCFSCALDKPLNTFSFLLLFVSPVHQNIPICDGKRK